MKGGMEWAAVNAGRQFASWPSGIFIRDVHFGSCKALFIGLNTIYFESMYRLSSCKNSVCIGGLFTSQCVVDVPGKQKSTAARSGLQSGCSSFPRVGEVFVSEALFWGFQEFFCNQHTTDLKSMYHLRSCINPTWIGGGLPTPP